MVNLHSLDNNNSRYSNYNNIICMCAYTILCVVFEPLLPLTCRLPIYLCIPTSSINIQEKIIRVTYYCYYITTR